MILWGNMHMSFNQHKTPSTKHQLILGNVYYELRKQLEMKHVSIFAPYTVYLRNVKGRFGHAKPQPDLSVVVSDHNIVRENCIVGAPDLIVEVLSHSNMDKDLVENVKLYEKNGVKEYWILDQFKNKAYVYKLTEGGQYIKSEDSFIIESELLQLELDLEKLF
ncbi:hypothetical protein BKK39_12570 [Bacillus cereus]|nr:Uma2 family endonuclease [Bacillus cytotoxicus]ONG97454.1 hypothetical protein BKK39_12570 [Bacillus cereus]HDR7214407.1 Uma2 family endonuclease [Bacillus cytotoxicus]HDR7741129.1 Uma2 family endonuclease [Bacillus pacificus]HDR7969264.1 Uma2 family endonuclease [Bacillus pacificus]